MTPITTRINRAVANPAPIFTPTVGFIVDLLDGVPGPAIRRGVRNTGPSERAHRNGLWPSREIHAPTRWLRMFADRHPAANYDKCAAAPYATIAEPVRILLILQNNRRRGRPRPIMRTGW